METKSQQEEVIKSMNGLWDLLTDEEKTLLARDVCVRSYEANETICEAGDQATHLMYLLEGGVKMLTRGVSVQRQIVRMVGPRAFFGYRSAFESQPSEYTAVSIEHSRVAQLPLPLLRQLLSENHHVSQFFIEELADILTRSSNATITLCQKHMRGRMAEVLLKMRDRYGTEADGRTLRLRLSRAEWGNISNMTTSNAIRTLSAFAGEGVLALEGRRIAILDEKELAAIASRG